MRVPFPNIDSGLAVHSHMYVCIKKGTQKEFIKCQSFKPQHLMRNKSPKHKIIESANITRNPFINKTTIDCDKSFYIEGVTIDEDLLANRRRDVCEDLFNSIIGKIKHKEFVRETIDVASFLTLNQKVRSGVN